MMLLSQVFKHSHEYKQHDVVAVFGRKVSFVGPCSVTRS